MDANIIEYSKDGFSVEFTMNMNLEDRDVPIGEAKVMTFMDKFIAPGNIRLLTKIGDDGACHVIETYCSPGAYFVIC